MERPLVAGICNSEENTRILHETSILCPQGGDHKDTS